MTDESTNAAAAMPPYAKREPKRREFHGDVFEDDYEWMRDKDSDDVRSYVAAENQYCERRMAHLADFRHTLFEELKSHVEETDMSVPTRVNAYWYFTRTQQGKQYGVQCRIPVRDADDWDPPVVDPQGAPGSMPGEQVVFDANKESEGHDFFRLGGLDLSKDGRWMLYGVDVAGDERYDFRIRDLAGLETGEPVSELPEQFTGIGSACFTPDGQWVFWVELDDSWRPLAVWRHRVGTAVESDVCVYRETDERFWVGVGISFDERNIVIGTGSKTTTEVLMLPVVTPEGEFQAFIPRQTDVEYDVSFACFEGRQLGRWNFNLLFGSWIDALSCSAFLYLKGTKANQRNLFACCQCFRNRVDHRNNSLFTVLFRKFCFLCNHVDQFCFRHICYPPFFHLIGPFPRLRRKSLKTPLPILPKATGKSAFSY